jgi:hypothetical protein
MAKLMLKAQGSCGCAYLVGTIPVARNLVWPSAKLRLQALFTFDKGTSTKNNFTIKQKTIRNHTP